MLGTISPQYFAYNQKNVTVQKLILFFCCMGMTLARDVTTPFEDFLYVNIEMSFL